MADPCLSHSLSCNELINCFCLCCISTLLGCNCDAQSLTTMLAHPMAAASVLIANCLLSHPMLLPCRTNGHNRAVDCRTSAAAPAAAPAAAVPASAEPAAAAAESSAADETASDASYSADELPQTSAMPRQSSNLMHASKLPKSPAFFIASCLTHQSQSNVCMTSMVYCKN